MILFYQTNLETSTASRRKAEKVFRVKWVVQQRNSSSSKSLIKESYGLQARGKNLSPQKDSNHKQLQLLCCMSSVLRVNKSWLKKYFLEGILKRSWTSQNFNFCHYFCISTWNFPWKSTSSQQNLKSELRVEAFWYIFQASSTQSRWFR